MKRPFYEDMQTRHGPYGIFVRWFEGTVIDRASEPRFFGLLRPRYVIIYDFQELDGPFAIVEDIVRWSRAKKDTTWWVPFESKDGGKTWKPSKGKYGLPPCPDDEPEAP